MKIKGIMVFISILTLSSILLPISYGLKPNLVESTNGIFAQSTPIQMDPIYIRADGSIYPINAPIQHIGEVYTITNDIESFSDGIIIERDNIVLDGAHHFIHGLWVGDPPSMYGIQLEGRKNVTITHITLGGFMYCIYISDSSNNIIQECNLSNSEGRYEEVGIELYFSNNNLITANNMTGNYYYGVYLYSSNYNNISGNNIVKNNNFGLSVESSNNNIITENNILENGYGLSITNSFSNHIFHNNVDFVYALENPSSPNIWDDGYPSGGNHWSSYLGVDTYNGAGQNIPGSDGIGDTPYTIDANNVDHYPLLYSWVTLTSRFKDSYETGFSTFTGTSTTIGETASVATTTPHHGSYSAYFTSNGGGGTENANSFKAFPSSPEIYTKGYFRVSKSGIAEDSDRFYFIVLKSANSNNLAYAGWRRTAGVTKWCLVIRNGAGYVTTYSTSTPTTNKWYCVELHWAKGSGGLGELYVDGVKVCTASGNTASYGDSAAAYFGLTEIFNCASTSAYGDCVQISTGYIYPELPNSVSISSSQNTGSTSNLGSMTFNGVSGSLPRLVSMQAGNAYSAQFTAPTGYVFSSWEITGSLKLSSTTANPVTVTVTGDGTLRAVYKTASAASITVTSPNTALSWVRGTIHTITWTSTGSPGANVKIELLKGSGVNRVISASTANDGSYSWTIPTTQTAGTDYKIRITSTTNAATTDSSNSNFAITVGALTVTSPNGGQSWIHGTAHTITWTSSGSPGTYVKIELLRAGVVNRVISSSTANDGSYSWTIPATQTPGTDYKIRVTSTTNTAITDSSNTNFSIIT